MRLLLVEQALEEGQRLERELGRPGHEIVRAETGSQALDRLREGDFDVVLANLDLPDFDAIELIGRVRRSGSDVDILVMTNDPSIRSAVAAFHGGAADYLVRPISTAELESRIREIVCPPGRDGEALETADSVDPAAYWLTETPSGRYVRELISRVGSTELTVLLTGEPGTGKGVAARLLHAAGRVPGGPFLPLECAALREGELSSERVTAAAAGGTLFLDEIGVLNEARQGELLRTLEEFTARPGPGTPRLIAATSRDLDEMVERGAFRRDLRSRIDVVHIHLPPLREQRDALPPAVDHLLSRRQALRRGRRVEVSPEAWDRLRSYDWPGNLRELEITLERALSACDGRVICEGDLPPSLLPAGDGGTKQGSTLKERVEEFERKVVQQTLDRVGGDRRIAARELGTSLSTVYRKLQESNPEAR